MGWHNHMVMVVGMGTDLGDSFVADGVVKVCKKHGELTLEKTIKAGIRNEEQIYRCKLCIQESHKKHYDINKEKVREKHNEYRNEDYNKFRSSRRISKRQMYVLDRQKHIKRSVEWDKNNLSRKRCRQRKFKTKAVKELS